MNNFPENGTEVKGQDINNVCQINGKTLAKLEWLRLWPKNPRIVDNNGLKRLNEQIKELGVYKPLLITSDGEILGGNQRYKVLSELKKENKKYEWIWVSIVEAWTDEERLKYALSDNDSIGKYTRDKMHEVLIPFLEQDSLFKNYNIEFSDKKSISKFINELALSEKELQLKKTKENLKELGVNDETIKIINDMVEFNKNEETLEDVDIQGCIIGQKFPLMFWISDETIYEQLHNIFSIGLKNNYNIEKLIEIVEKHFDIKLPTDNDTIQNLMEKLKTINEDISFAKETNDEIKILEEAKEELKIKIKGIFYNLFPEEIKKI